MPNIVLWCNFPQNGTIAAHRLHIGSPSITYVNRNGQVDQSSTVVSMARELAVSVVSVTVISRARAAAAVLFSPFASSGRHGAAGGRVVTGVST